MCVYKSVGVYRYLCRCIDVFVGVCVQVYVGVCVEMEVDVCGVYMCL